MIYSVGVPKFHRTKIMDAETLKGLIVKLNHLTSELMTVSPALSVQSGEVAGELIKYLDALDKSSTKQNK